MYGICLQTDMDNLSQGKLSKCPVLTVEKVCGKGKYGGGFGHDESKVGYVLYLNY